MKNIYIVAIALISSSHLFGSALKCDYTKQNSCEKGYNCVFDRNGSNESYCRKEYSGKLLTIKLPYSVSERVFCEQGTQTEKGNSHTNTSNLFALDLDTRLFSKTPYPMVAGVGGKVIAYNNCKTHNDNCGTGQGNNVRILTKDGFMISYSHMDEVFVKTGDSVVAGQEIGTDGETGSTGPSYKHVHLAVHYDWRTKPFDYWARTVDFPPSIPFLVSVCSNNSTNEKCKLVSLDTRDFSCRRNKKNKVISNNFYTSKF